MEREKRKKRKRQKEENWKNLFNFWMRKLSDNKQVVKFFFVIFIYVAITIIIKNKNNYSFFLSVLIKWITSATTHSGLSRILA